MTKIELGHLLRLDNFNKVGACVMDLFDCRLNVRTNEGRLSYIITKTSAGTGNLVETLEAERRRMGDGDFNYYYGPTSLKIAEELETLWSSWTPEERVAYILFLAEDTAVFRGYHFANVRLLLEEGMVKAIYDFDCNFRGDIKEIHKVGYGAMSKPFRVLQTYRDSSWTFNVLGKNGSVDINAFGSFEEAVFYKLSPRHYAAMNALYLNDKED